MPTAFPQQILFTFELRKRTIFRLVIPFHSPILLVCNFEAVNPINLLWYTTIKKRKKKEKKIEQTIYGTNNFH